MGGRLRTHEEVYRVGGWDADAGRTERERAVSGLVFERQADGAVAASAEGTAVADSGGVRWWRVAALTAGLVIVIAVGGALSTRSAANNAAAAGETKCNRHEELCDRRLDEVVFATSHNSMSAAREPGWLFGEHLGGIRAQLEYGVRGFLIDTHYGVPSGITVPGVPGMRPSCEYEYLGS